MSKTAKTSGELMHALETIARLGKDERQHVAEFVSEQGRMAKTLEMIEHNLVSEERAVLFQMLRSRYKDDGVQRQKPGRRPKQAPDGAGGGDGA